MATRKSGSTQNSKEMASKSGKAGGKGSAYERPIPGSQGAQPAKKKPKGEDGVKKEQA